MRDSFEWGGGGRVKFFAGAAVNNGGGGFRVDCGDTIEWR